jgi:hypothetical protein
MARPNLKLPAGLCMEGTALNSEPEILTCSAMVVTHTSISMGVHLDREEHAVGPNMKLSAYQHYFPARVAMARPNIKHPACLCPPADSPSGYIPSPAGYHQAPSGYMQSPPAAGHALPPVAVSAATTQTEAREGPLPLMLDLDPRPDWRQVKKRTVALQVRL